MLRELSWGVTYEMLNSADTSSLKAELKENSAKGSLPQLSLSICGGGGFYIS